MVLYLFAGGLWKRGGEAHRGRVCGAHVRNQQARLTNYLLPMFGEWKLDEITGADIDRALLHIRENAKPKRATRTGRLSNRTVNALHAALSAVFAEAVRQGYVVRNPMQEVPRLAAKGERRGILTPPELRELLNPERAAEVWRHPRYWLLFRLAVTTGARSGELRTLHVEDVRPDHILIRRSWDDVEGLTPDTKNGEERTAPLAEGLYNDLVAWARTTNTSEGYLFPSPKEAGAPIDRDSVMKNYRAALERMGISREEQRRRNIDGPVRVRSSSSYATRHCLRHGDGIRNDSPGRGHDSGKSGASST